MLHSILNLLHTRGFIHIDGEYKDGELSMYVTKEANGNGDAYEIDYRKDDLIDLGFFTDDTQDIKIGLTEEQVLDTLQIK